MRSNSKLFWLMLTWMLTLIAVLTLFLRCHYRPAPGESPLIVQSPLLQPPIVTPSTEVTGVRFMIDKPLVEGATRVTGRGPSGILLQVVDITMGGEVLGTGAIGDDNKFEIKLAVPLSAGRVIGIQLATPREAETWLALWELRGENAKSIPQMGYFFDSAVTVSDSEGTP